MRNMIQRFIANAVRFVVRCSCTKMVKIASHQRLQYYDPHYAKACMTGLFGGRWKRYQQSKDDTGKWDLFWFSLLCLVFFSMSLWLHFWLVAYNSYDSLNRYFMSLTGSFFRWYDLFIILTSITFTYVALLMVLGVLHLACSQELYIHYIHKSLLAVIFLFCAAFTFVVPTLWDNAWILFSISLQYTGPFLQLSAVVVMTFMSWFIAKNWIWLVGKTKRIVTLCLFITLMLSLYLSPLAIQSSSPCIMDASVLPSKPLVVGHRGAAALAPENTIASFDVGGSLDNLRALETDITISSDGVLFALHDKTFRRTTNIRDVFPGRVDDSAFTFNISDVQKLNAGRWFLHTDPHGTVSQLTEEQKKIYRNQSIPTFTEVLQVVKKYNTSLMFDLNFLVYANPSHPYWTNFTDIVVQTIKEANFDMKKILWLQRQYNGHNITVPTGVTVLERYDVSVEEILRKNSSGVNIDLALRLSAEQAHAYNSNSLITNIYTVNSGWLYSLYWCAGVQSVTSNWAHKLPDRSKPDWTLHPDVYLAIWITTDVISVIVIIIFFLIHRVKQKGLNFSPDVVSLNAAKQRVRKVSQIRQSRNMKEKLIRAGGDAFGAEVDGSHGASGINGLQPEGSPAPASHPVSRNTSNRSSPGRSTSFTNQLNLDQVTVEVNNEPIPGTSFSQNGDVTAFSESLGDLSVVSEPASEPSTPSAHSANDIRMREVKADVV